MGYFSPSRHKSKPWVPVSLVNTEMRSSEGYSANFAPVAQASRLCGAGSTFMADISQPEGMKNPPYLPLAKGGKKVPPY
jgi:hypothetical protein